MNQVHIFPAFVPEYTGVESCVIGPGALEKKLAKASELTGLNISDFDAVHNNFLENPLASQYITYVLSCSVSDLLHQYNFQPSFVSAFSMGIYAAYYHCRVIDFKSGILMIKNAYDIIEQNLPDFKCGMCVIGGLNKQDIHKIISQYDPEVEVINQNSEFSFILSGNFHSLCYINQAASDEGAMQVRMLPVSHPYHTSILSQAAGQFGEYLQNLELHDSIFNYFSSINQKTLSSENDLRQELVQNICLPFNWLATFKALAAAGNNTFIECGGGESLYKISRFIDGEFSVISIKKLLKFLNQ